MVFELKGRSTNMACMEEKMQTETYLKAMKNRHKLDHIRDSPRCAGCCKYEAKDSTNVNKDEVTRLSFCSGCKLVQYCSRDCQIRNRSFHKQHCNELLDSNLNKSVELHDSRMRLLEGFLKCPEEDCKCVTIYLAEKDPKMHLFATALYAEDVGLCKKFLHYAFEVLKTNIEPEILGDPSTLFAMDQEIGFPRHVQFLFLPVTGMLIYLGRYQEAYDFFKYWLTAKPEDLKIGKITLKVNRYNQ